MFDNVAFTIPCGGDRAECEVLCPPSSARTKKILVRHHSSKGIPEGEHQRHDYDYTLNEAGMILLSMVLLTPGREV
jgi:hypothetical protein